MNRRTLIMGAVAVVAIALIAVGIIYFTRPGGGDENEIKIGAVYSQTGAAASIGKSSLQGVQLAIEEINAQGGIKGRKIVLIVEDGKSNPTDAASACQKLMTVDKVPVIVGPASSSLALACAPLANRNKVVLLSTGAATPAYSSPDDYTFRNWLSAGPVIEKMADIIYEKLNLTRIAILYGNYDIAVGSKSIFEPRYEQLGGTIVAAEAFEQGSTDMRSQLTKIRAANPQGIYLLALASEAGYALRQMRELGMNIPAFGVAPIESQDVLNIAGEAANGVIYTLPAYNPNDPNPRVQAYEKKFQDRYGKASDAFAATAYDAIYILKEAMEKGGFTAEGIKNALYQIRDFPGVTGDTTFDRNGDVRKPVGIKMIKDGKFIFLDDNLQPVSPTRRSELIGGGRLPWREFSSS